MAKTTAKNKSSNIPQGVLKSLKAILDVSKIQHEEAREGSAIIAEFDDDLQYKIFKDICITRSSPMNITQKLSEDGLISVDGVHKVAAALRRLSVVGAPIADKIRAESQRKPRQKKVNDLPEASFSLNPGLSGLEAHIEASKAAPKDYDCVAKMAGLASVLEQQFKDLYTYKPREAQPFFEVQKVNMVAQTFMTAVEKLHKMQMDVGIVEKSPEKMEVNLQHAGAFQTYVGELSHDHKQTMVDFAGKFAQFVKEKKESE